MDKLVGLLCTNCGRRFQQWLLTKCQVCGAVLDTEFNLDFIMKNVSRSILKRRQGGMWRWFEFLPVYRRKFIVSAGEGGTPLRKASKLGEAMGLSRLYYKDETKNPTASFKDRGASSAVSRLDELGVRRLVIASEGNAACSFALYTRLSGINLRAFVPSFADPLKIRLIEFLGGKVYLTRGTILDAGRRAAKEAQEHHLYDASTFSTPFRHDGKGTMALEICEQLGWESPDAIVYPVGGGVGIVGMWKAVKLLYQLGWVSHLPRMIAVQATGCAPIVKAFKKRLEDVEAWKNPSTRATGLMVPRPRAGKLILRALQDSRGTAVAVSEKEILHAQREALSREGLLIEPSAAAAFASLRPLTQIGDLGRDETIVVIATGSSLKSLR